MTHPLYAIVQSNLIRIRFLPYRVTFFVGNYGVRGGLFFL